MKARFGRAWKILAEHGWLLVAMAVAVKLPLEGASWALAGALDASVTLNLLLGAVQFLLPPLYCGAVIAAAAVYANSGYATLPSAYAASARAYTRTLGAYLIAMAATLAGVMLFVLPGLFLAGRLAFALPAVVLEGRTAGDACRRSWNLSKDHLPELAAYVAVLFVPLALTGALLSGQPPGIATLLGRGVLMSVFEVFYLLLITDFFRELTAPKRNAPAGMPGEVLYRPIEDMARREDGGGPR